MRNYGLYLFSILILVHQLCCISESNASPSTPPMFTEYYIRILRIVNPGNCPIVELEYNFGPSQRSQGKETIVTLTANNGLRINDDSIWQVVLESDQHREGTLILRINTDDTSSFDLHIEGGARPETHTYYFIYEPGNIDCYQGNRFTRRPIAKKLRPFIYQKSLEITESNNIWLDSTDYNGKHAGYIHTVKSRSDTSIAPIFVMHGGYSTTNIGRARRYDIYCDDNEYLTLHLLSMKTKFGNYVKFDTTFFSKGSWSPSYSRHNKFESNKDDIFEPVLYHVVQGLPFEEGIVLQYSIPQWDIGLRLVERRIEYLGQEEVRVIDACDSTVMLHKMVDAGYHYYLDDNHNLVLVYNGNTNLIRVTKEFLTPELFEINWDSLETALINK